MLNNERLQLVGPASVIGAILCAHVSAYALANCPTSSLLWYLNLEVFRSFRYGIDVSTVWLGPDGLAQSIWIAVPLLGLACIALLVKGRLPFAIASHLSVIYSAFIFYCSYEATGSTLTRERASALYEPSNLIAISILLASLISSTISHRQYWREILSYRRCSYCPRLNSGWADTATYTGLVSRWRQLRSFAISGLRISEPSRSPI